jgi:tetratricopeptide (TPR) repeat protein
MNFTYQILIDSPDRLETQSYLADLDLAISRFAHPLDASDLLTLIQLHTARYVALAQNKIIQDSLIGISFKNLLLMERDFKLDSVTSTLAKIGQITKAVDCAAIIEDKQLQSKAIEGIVDILLKHQQFTEVAQTIPWIPSEHGRDWMRCQWIIELVRLKQFDEAKSIIQTITDGWLKSRALSTLGQESAFTEAETTAKKIQNLKQQCRALRDLAGGLAQAQQFDRAFATAAQIQRDSERNEALELISLALARAGQLSQALVTAQNIPDENQRESVLSHLIEVFVEIKQLEQAYETLRFISTENGQQWALHGFTRKLIETGQFTEAQQLLDQMDEDATPRYEVMNELISALVEAEQATAAVELAQRVKDNNWKIYVLNHLAIALSQRNLPCETVIAQSKQIIDSFSDEEIKNRNLYYLAEALVRSGRFDEGQIIIDQLSGSQALDNDWNSLPYALLEKGYWYEALDLAVIKDPIDFVIFLCSCSHYFEQTEAQLSLKVLQKVTRIVSWILPNWREIQTILAGVA